MCQSSVLVHFTCMSSAGQKERSDQRISTIGQARLTPQGTALSPHLLAKKFTFALAAPEMTSSYIFVGRAKLRPKTREKREERR